MLDKIVIIFALLFVVGCTPNIREYDAEKLEFDQITKLKKAQSDPFNAPSTPAIVRVAEDKDEKVYIEVIKLKPITNQYGIKLDVWTVNAVNNSPITKCVKVLWKLQDFEFESEQPLEFMLTGNQQLNIGKMRQSIWSFEEEKGTTLIAIPPSGYVDALKVRNAELDKKTNRLTCEMLEKDIDDLKKDTNAIEM
jgi:hypothetical protein